MTKRDMSEMLRAKASARTEEMNTTKMQIESGEIQQRSKGRPVENPDDPKCAVTISLRTSTHQRLKFQAVREQTSASALVERWVEEHCEPLA